MILTRKQCEQYLITNGRGKAAQVGYDLTLKGSKKICGGLIGIDQITPAPISLLNLKQRI